MAPLMTAPTMVSITKSLEGALAAIQSQARIALRTASDQKTRQELRELLLAAELAGASMRLLADFARYDVVATL
jgi:hypothetical protein